MTGWIVTGGIIALLGTYAVALAVVIHAADRQELNEQRKSND